MTSRNQAEVTQTVILPQSRDALFITLGFKEGGEQAALEVLSSLSSLTNGVGFRYPEAHLSAVAGVGAKMWDRLFALDKPEHLHEFVELTGAKHHAPSTPGDVFFHIRSDEFDVAFELARRINAIVEDHIDYYDEVHAFQYQDFRDPLGFVDGTESPRGQEGVEVAIIRDGIWKGGSYIVEQKYVHNLKDWNALPVEEQERVIGRTKHSDVELDEKAPNSHVAVNQVEDEDGNGLEIVRNKAGHLLHELHPRPPRHRSYAAADVHRRAGGQIRPHPGLLRGADRLQLLRPDAGVFGPLRRLRPRAPALRGRRGAEPAGDQPAAG